MSANEDKSDISPLPLLPWHGGCQCGQVRYQINAYPLTLYGCHCSECQKQSSSVYGLSLRIRPVRSVFQANWLNGRARQRQAIPCFGTTIFAFNAVRAAVSPARPVQGGSGWRDDERKGEYFRVIAELEPAGHIWLASRQKGTVIAPGLLEYDGQPENYDALMQAWSAKHGLPMPGAGK
ncbi:MAG: aldehyde-activating protein [Nitratireductor sp.]